MISGPDQNLLTRVRDGKPPVLAEVFDLYGAECLALARRLVTDANAAEEIVLRVFVRLWRHPPELAVPMRFWLLSQVLRHGRDIL